MSKLIKPNGQWQWMRQPISQIGNRVTPDERDIKRPAEIFEAVIEKKRRGRPRKHPQPESTYVKPDVKPDDEQDT